MSYLFLLLLRWLLCILFLFFQRLLSRIIYNDGSFVVRDILLC